MGSRKEGKKRIDPRDPGKICSPEFKLIRVQSFVTLVGLIEKRSSWINGRAVGDKGGGEGSGGERRGLERREVGRPRVSVRDATRRRYSESVRDSRFRRVPYRKRKRAPTYISPIHAESPRERGWRRVAEGRGERLATDEARGGGGEKKRERGREKKEGKKKERKERGGKKRVEKRGKKKNRTKGKEEEKAWKKGKSRTLVAGGRQRCHYRQRRGEKGCFAERHRAYGEPYTLIGWRAYEDRRGTRWVRRQRLQTDTRPFEGGRGGESRKRV